MIAIHIMLLVLIAIGLVILLYVVFFRKSDEWFRMLVWLMVMMWLTDKLILTVKNIAAYMN